VGLVAALDSFREAAGACRLGVGAIEVVADDCAWEHIVPALA
jgi:hypothetical protein